MAVQSKGLVMRSKKFKNMFEPGKIGSLKTKNRIIKTAAGTGFIEDDNTVGEVMKRFFEAIARGGPGLIIWGYTTVEFPRGAYRPVGLKHFTDDKLIPNYHELTDLIHKYDCPVFIQIMHSGSWFAQGLGMEPGDRIGASTLKPEELPGSIFIPIRELSTGEVEELIETFGKVALRAQKAGFDGIEINGSHHHLINSFFSRFWNRRHDKYGCDNIENRARFICDIIREIKTRCGKEYPVDALINAVEYGVKDGITLEETKKFAPLIQAAGADIIQVRACGYYDLDYMLHAERFMYPELPEKVRKLEGLDFSRQGRGVTVPLGAAIKPTVTIPVFVAGRLDPELGEQLLEEGKLDFIGMSRRLFADPELPNKVAAGHPEDIAPCMGCNYCWHVRAYQSLPLKCKINAAIGAREDYGIKKADKKKRVLIAGAGPGGLEAARVAALRGHEVLICDKETQLGGSARLAATVKDLEMDAIMDMIQYFKTQLTKSGVTVRLGKEVNQSVIEQVKPDVLILATGGAPAILDIPGIDHKKVMKSEKLHQQLKLALKYFGEKSSARLTRFWMPIGKKVIIIGSGLHGCQVGEFLVKRGRKVTIVDTAPTPGEGLLAFDPVSLFAWFKEKDVTILNGVKYEKIDDSGLTLITKEGEKKTLEADSIVVALPLRSNSDLFKRLEGKVKEIYQVGDCREPHYMAEAISDGWNVARKI